MELIAAFLLGFFLGGVFIYNVHGSRESQPAQVEKAGIVYDRSGKAVMGSQPPPMNPHSVGPPQSRKVRSMGTGSASLPDDNPASPPPL